jgi:hypothetical protein
VARCNHMFLSGRTFRKTVGGNGMVMTAWPVFISQSQHCRWNYQNYEKCLFNKQYPVYMLQTCWLPNNLLTVFHPLFIIGTMVTNRRTREEVHSTLLPSGVHKVTKYDSLQDYLIDFHPDSLRKHWLPGNLGSSNALKTSGVVMHFLLILLTSCLEHVESAGL